MEKISIKASRNYDILIGNNIISNTGNYIKEVSKAKKVVIITDDIVDKLYSQTVSQSLVKAGFQVEKFVFLHGEGRKSHETLLELYEFLVEKSITRTDLLIALGGGVVGDLTGFAAASYLRGVDFVQIPTTLLSQVDSSVGGKTGVNIKGGKNLIGAFNQPILVLCDIKTLATLTDEIFADGMAEVIKYGMIRSAELFSLVEKGNPKADLKEIISQCIQIKANVVENDEFDTGERMILNFGHTLGHALEKFHGYGGISHGQGVAMGMGVFAKISQQLELTENGIWERLCNCLKANHLPFTTDVPLEELYALTLRDKKRNSGNINIVICPKIGVAEIKNLTIEEYRKFLIGE